MWQSKRRIEADLKPIWRRIYTVPGHVKWMKVEQLWTFTSLVRSSS